MGNSGSHTNQVSQREIPEEHWAHSFPRTQTAKFGYQHKVLPDRDGDLKLKSTNNGDILHSGGTLTGKPKSLDDKKNEHSFHGYEEDRPAIRKYFPREKETQYRSRAQGVQHKLNQNASSQRNLQGQIKLCVSEPDLRYSSDAKQHLREKKCKKKYKAPPPPAMTDKPYLEWTETNNPLMPIRKARLFKTRAEMKKQSSQTNDHAEYSDNPINISINVQRTSKSNRLSLPEIKLGDDDFFEELKMATSRLRHNDFDSKTDNSKALDPNALKPHQDAKEKLIEKLDSSKNKMANSIRGEASGKESTTPEVSPEVKKRAEYTREKPKTFYFGMNEEQVTDCNINCNNDIFDKFSNSFHQNTKLHISSASDISSDIHSEDGMFKSGLDLQLRPILPKKQLEIPKFSPAAAWRLLSMDASDKTGGTVISDDVSVLVEDRIEKLARSPPPLIHAGQRSSNDKSGDSGISGDDPIPNGAYEDNNEGAILQHQHVEFTLSSYNNPQDRISWTPQQDLGDDSSIEEFKNQKSPSAPTSRNRSGAHIFSLSLPRDNQLAAYMIERSSLQYSGLQKLKKSLSGVFGSLSNRKDVTEASEFDDETSANWFLSKSAPNSINAFHSLEVRKTHDKEHLQLLNVNKQARMMYLPELEPNCIKIDDAAWRGSRHSFGHSKSCEDLALEVKKTPEPLQDSVKEEYPWIVATTKPKKFTFQSTIRQIEKRRLSEKLSREAERREQKRIQELEAMEKVEEEFQRKRAREKADIRQQLRLICMEKNPAWSSLPPNLEMNAEIRPEPDGAISSTSSTSPTPKTRTMSTRPFQKFKSSKSSRSGNNMKVRVTPENSEFSSIPREYMDYRGVKYSNDGGVHRHTTVHPEVTCNMPKVKGTKLATINNDHRREMAAGARSTITVGSTDSENSHKYRSIHASHNISMPMSYFREDQLHC